MDPRDRPFDLVSDADCAACGRPVPRERVRLLARRQDLAFAELPCEPCGSVSLAIFVGPTDPGTDRTTTAAQSTRAADPLGADDVLDMHLFLDSWAGDLRTLVEPSDRAGGPAGAA